MIQPFEYPRAPPPNGPVALSQDAEYNDQERSQAQKRPRPILPSRQREQRQKVLRRYGYKARSIIAAWTTGHRHVLLQRRLGKCFSNHTPNNPAHTVHAPDSPPSPKERRGIKVVR
ncbi:hypothetical protein CCHR01_19745 [Colletotrichum chrysophilum]|uniref:Uncharacterized protein n=1 Tax=Colletotrichum chrysophilum TaxID=1836956 RepID=A0AAD9E7J9_9PEZI|nr:hypothetical protein CCHR01_19745 [Colletotrichum chrysophilum]